MALPQDELDAIAARSADPAAAAVAMARLRESASEDLTRRLDGNGGLVQAICVVMASSEFLAEAMVQSPELALWLDEERRRPSSRAREDWAATLAALAAAAGPSAAEREHALAGFKRREYLRIAWRDLSGQAELGETTQDLSHLADAILQQNFAWAWNDLASRYGTPRLAGGPPAEFAVIGLGKLGAEELNYSSDIDLMFLHAGDGETAGGAAKLGNREFFTRLAQAITAYASTTYRVDLRLRPGGREGELVHGLEAAVAYYRTQARGWEHQMLIRARGCAGSRGLAAQFTQQVRGMVYPVAPSEQVLAEGVRESRAGISAQLARRRSLGRRTAAVDVKLDPGGIRDIEFLAQFLQRLRGGRAPWLRSGSTLVGLQRLYDKGQLPMGEWQQLAAAYTLLRHVEHRLQLRMGQQTHALPTGAERMAVLARSLEAVLPNRQGAMTGAELEHEVRRRMDGALRIYRKYLEPPDLAADSRLEAPILRSHAGEELAPSDWPAHARRQWDRLWRSAATQEHGREQLESLGAEARRRLQVALGASDWMAEALIRSLALTEAFERAGDCALQVEVADLERSMAELRKWRMRRTLRLLIEEWEQRQPVGKTLGDHTRTAEGVLRAGLRLVPQAPDSLAVLALGRMGLGELDLQSDLDLVFVSELDETEAAARASAKLIQVLTAYTQAGALYAVDTRLRPRGREGELVLTPAGLAQHFRGHGDVWEGVSYLKARYVAGNEQTARAALDGVRAACVERFAGKALGAELAALRTRIENEGRPGRWGLKTGPGGYYDSDLLASRRWLESGLCPPIGQGLAASVSALPEALLPRAIGRELGDLVELLRAGDHALRVATGFAGHRVPAAGAAVERGWDWLARTTGRPRSEVDAGLVDRARERVREIFRSVE